MINQLPKSLIEDAEKAIDKAEKEIKESSLKLVSKVSGETVWTRGSKTIKLNSKGKDGSGKQVFSVYQIKNGKTIALDRFDSEKEAMSWVTYATEETEQNEGTYTDHQKQMVVNESIDSSTRLKLELFLVDYVFRKDPIKVEFAVEQVLSIVLKDKKLATEIMQSAHDRKLVPSYDEWKMGMRNIIKRN